ncbi:Putative peptidoglycan binding domain-containing protein [Alteribacillus bidgolensis]|uniref:Putative peptidoglycan binding domain-containing protein n=2 Tax=Alteribacillus bidgolensis TaxID=930129 RepID=A0A1G8RBE7_9BACI|nr:Putative peptidoglycan binding domain-containing protein [Alteribacillus bidgolensis]
MRRMKPILFIALLLLCMGSGYSEEKAEINIQIDLWNRHLQLIEDGKVVKVFPIAPGSKRTPTPVGTFEIDQKGRGWGGGFGTRWLGLNVPWGMYGIHGTNKPHLIGKDVSAGCIRMENKDIEWIYEKVSLGTTVHIVGPITGPNGEHFATLAKGSHGSLVFLVQNRLKAAGYYRKPCNGLYDKYMVAVVKEFQRSEKLPVTGYFLDRDYIKLGLLE